MGHPFFDELKYPATRPDAVAFWEVLQTVFAKEDEIRSIFTTSGGNEAKMTWGRPAEAIWRDVLGYLTRAGLLHRLCENLLADASFENNFAEGLPPGTPLLWLERAATSGGTGPSSGSWLPLQIIDRLDRPDLRRLCKYLLGPDPLEVLARSVLGVPDSIPL
jgi:hypothetical protein